MSDSHDPIPAIIRLQNHLLELEYWYYESTDPDEAASLSAACAQIELEIRDEMEYMEPADDGVVDQQGF